MEFDLSKENIQPLRGGRNAVQLGAALQAQSDVEYQKELLQQKEAFETAIRNYTGTDPLENWYNYISWVEQSYPKQGYEGNLPSLLEDCLGKFENDDKYKQDTRLCKLWIKYVDMQENRLELFNLLYQQGICTECSDFYRAWAYYYEAGGDFKQADGIFKLGFRANAQPADELQYAYQTFTLAVGRHVLNGAVDATKMADRRRALTSLRGYKHRRTTVAPNERVGSSVQHSVPGTYKCDTAAARSNARVDVFEDENELVAGPSTGGEKSVKSVLEASKRETVHKENMLKAGPWNSSRPKKSIASNSINGLQFIVHEDEDECVEPEPVKITFKYPPNFHDRTKEVFTDMCGPTCVPDPYDPTKIPQYKQNEIYCDNTEYSFEELLARKWFEKQKRQEKECIDTGNNQIQYVEEPFMIHDDTPILLAQEDGSIVQVADFIAQSNQDLAPRTTVYTTTPLKTQLSVLTVSSPLKNNSHNHSINHKSVTNLACAFNAASPTSSNSPNQTILASNNKSHTSLLHHSLSLPQNTAEEVAKAVESIPEHTWSDNLNMNPNIPHTIDSSVTVHTKAAMLEVNALWSDSHENTHLTNPIVEMPQKIDNGLPFQILEDETKPIVTEILAPSFSIYTNDASFQKQNEYNSPNVYKINDKDIIVPHCDENVYYTNENAVINNLVTNTDGQYGAIIPEKFIIYENPENDQPQVRSSNFNFEDTCSTEMFNFNINRTKASTPCNDKKTQGYSNVPAYYHNHRGHGIEYKHSVQQQLFPELQVQKPPHYLQYNNRDYYLGNDTTEPKNSDDKLSIILECTKEYPSSSSSSSNGTAFKAATVETLPVIKEHSRSYKEEYGMEYEVGEAMLQLSQEIPVQQYEINIDNERVENRQDYYDLYMDQNSKNSTDTVQMTTPTNTRREVKSSLETMDWDEQSNSASCDFNQQNSYLDNVLASSKPIDPFDRKIIESLLKKARFPNERHLDGYITVPNVAKPTTKDILALKNDRFSIEKILGKGTFGTVVRATNINEGTVVALKYEKPLNYWEYYICKEIQHRVTEFEMRLSFMDVIKGYFSRNASILISEFSKYGSLLNVANKVKERTGKPMKELVIYHFATEIIRIINTLHQCQIIHADIKPDNFLVMCMPPDSNRLSLQLIDFGCSIDMSLLPKGTQFYKTITTENFTCTEMRDGRPWTYQTDLFCAAATVYVLLLGEYMNVQKRGDVWTISKKLPRYLNQDVWSVFFMQMLNIESCDSLPDLTAVQMTFQSIINEKYLNLMGDLRNLANNLNGR